VHVAFDQVAAGRDRRAKRLHRVLRLLGRIASVTTNERSAVVVRCLVTCAYRLGQGRRSV